MLCSLFFAIGIDQYHSQKSDRSEIVACDCATYESLHIINKYKKYIYFTREKKEEICIPFVFRVHTMSMYESVLLLLLLVLSLPVLCLHELIDNRSILSHFFLSLSLYPVYGIVTASYLFAKHIIFISLIFYYKCTIGDSVQCSSFLDSVVVRVCTFCMYIRRRENDSIWHGHHNGMGFDIFKIHNSRDDFAWECLATATFALSHSRPVFIVGTLSHVQFIYSIFFSLHSLFSRSLVDPFFVGLNAGLKCEWTHSEAEKSSPDQRMFMFSNFVYHFKFCGINIWSYKVQEWYFPLLLLLFEWWRSLVVSQWPQQLGTWPHILFCWYFHTTCVFII